MVIQNCLKQMKNSKLSIIKIQGATYRAHPFKKQVEIDMMASTYIDLRKYRDIKMQEVRFDPLKLNQLHDQLMANVAEIAIHQITARFGAPPSPFTFFVMGSAGRFEQSVWGDQDHGIIFSDSHGHAQDYFLRLGEEISKGLFYAGYPYCDGGVMADNPLWCKSLKDWQLQLTSWVNESTWESIRHLLIFIDARPLYNKNNDINDLKHLVYQSIKKRHQLRPILENTIHAKKGLNALGQFLINTHGSYAGMLNIKDRVLIPYVNAARTLAFAGQLDGTSTLSRLQFLKDDYFINNFKKLLEFRLLYSNPYDYQSGHYIAIHSLAKKDQLVLKEIIKSTSHLQKSVKNLLEKEGLHRNE